MHLQSSGCETPELVFNTVIPWSSLWLIQPGWVRIWGFSKQRQGTEPLRWFRWPMLRMSKRVCFNAILPDDTAASLLRLWDSWNHLQHSNTMINFMANPIRTSQNLRVFKAATRNQIFLLILTEDVKESLFECRPTGLQSSFTPQAAGHLNSSSTQ